MRKIGFLVILFLAICGMASAGWTYNLAELGVHEYGGHYYMAVSGKYTWNDAWTAAQTTPLPDPIAGNFSANLASLTSAGENDFVWSELGTDLRHYWLGGYQPTGTSEPVDNWRWVDNEDWLFSNWFTPAEPNDAGGKQSYLSFRGGPQGKWMDVREDWAGIKGFVVEFSPTAVPLPAPVLLLASGIIGLLAIRRRSGT